MTDSTRSPVHAAIYDLVMRPLEAFGLARQRQRTAAEARGHVLEIAAGTGAMFEYYGGDVAQVVATEPDPHMLRRAEAPARRASVPITLQLADAQQLPFDDGSFDTVVVTLSLCTIPDPKAAMAEARRVLRPDGRLVFLEHVASRRPVVGRLQSGLTPVWRRIAGGCHLDRETQATIEDAGFALERVWRSGKGEGAMIQGVARPRPSAG